ncbi:hypothetical protein [Zwartia sp.]|uniref:bestrophin-like domain n=1 Tax=Zwartia sp. TaxID=2978004 RepID=UPI002720B9B9|nr:hypothetical protein [Zwartia sp.]MDO9023305.1 DUF4239 domain-containing protein [Zwartia sp.]
MNFFENMEYGRIIVFYSVAGLLFTYGLYFALRKLFPNFIVQDVDSDFIAGLHAALFTITFLTLGYSLANVGETADKYQQDVVAEANEIKSLDVLLGLYDTEASTNLRKVLRQYATSIVKDEWPLLAKSHGSDTTLALQRQIRADLQNLDPKTGKELAIYTEILKTSAKIVQARSSRILNSGARLAPQYMATSNIGYLGVLIISALMLTQFTWFRFVALIVQVVAVSFIFAATIVLDNPFKGSDKISAEPIMNVAESPVRLSE